MVSTSIPDEELAGRVRMETGSFGNQQTHTAIGGQSGAWGYSLEWMQLASDGFKVLDGGGNTGFDKADRVAKLQWSSANGRHVLRGKAMSSDEESRETYLGLAQADFDVSPMRRYAASAQDLMTTAHSHTVVGHEFKPTEDLGLDDGSLPNPFRPELVQVGPVPWTRWAKSVVGRARWKATIPDDVLGWIC